MRHRGAFSGHLSCLSLLDVGRLYVCRRPTQTRAQVHLTPFVAAAIQRHGLLEGRDHVIVVSAGLGAVVGAVAGRALGRSNVRESWAPVERFTVAATPAEGGMAVRLRWRLP